MARLALSAALLLSSLTTAAHAQSTDDPEVQAAADEAGVPIDALMGAMASTGLGPRTYLMAVGELAPVVPFTVWDRLAECESNGRWAANTGNGYEGGLQFDLRTWRAYGGIGHPAQASRATQIAVAERLRAARGFVPWPVCSRRLGLR
jgi:hypothetical protein